MAVPSSCSGGHLLAQLRLKEANKMIKKAHKVIHTRTHNDLMCHCPVPNCCIDISEVQRFNMTLEPLPAGFETCLTHRTCASYFHSRELGSNENTAGGAYCHRRISSCIALVCTQQILRIFYRTLGIAVAAGHKNMLRRPSLQADL